jgi:uncharacterized protein YdiU (UPF0061 family)
VLGSAGAADDAPLGPLLLPLARAAARRFAHTAAEWLRVGYVQSNYNADNCHVGGLTLDYGPFGFLEKYDAKWGMWIGTGDHFAFRNQPRAAGRNLGMLLQSLEPLLGQDAAALRELRGVAEEFDGEASRAVDGMWAHKLGFAAASDETRRVWAELEQLMAAHPTDFTILWRQLSHLPAAAAAAAADAAADAAAESRPADAVASEYREGTGKVQGRYRVSRLADAAILAALHPAWYEESRLPQEQMWRWRRWTRAWLAALDGSAADGLAAASARMLRANPKFVPREWMLEEVYSAAERGDHAPLHELHRVLAAPFDEQDEGVAARFYRRAPSGADKQGGIGFMS